MVCSLRPTELHGSLATMLSVLAVTVVENVEEVPSKVGGGVVAPESWGILLGTCCGADCEM